MMQLIPPPVTSTDERPVPPTSQEPAPPTPDGYYILSSEQVQTLEPIFKEHGQSLPNPGTCTFFGYVKDKEVVAFLVLQIRLCAEPMWVKPGHSDVFMGLASRAEQALLDQSGPQWVYLHTSQPKVGVLATKLGFEEQPDKVYAKLVQPKMPNRPPGFFGLDEE